MNDLPRPAVDRTGRYVIERELGRGGTSTVYLARDATSSRLVALKILRRELAESIGAERFLREIRLTASLHHPNITAILDSGERDGDLFCVLPYMEGGTLRQRLDRERQLPIDEATRIVESVARALEYAHSRGVVHRDVKPENILFADGEPCLADFGIARALENVGMTTSTGIVRGTPTYMSPEQASADRALDGRSDQYSLACVLYEMIAGVPPFVGATAQSVIAQRFTAPPRPVSAYRSTVTEALDQVLARAMQVAPADRYASVQQFADAVRAASAVNARVPHSAPRISRARLAALGGAALVIAAAAVGISRWRTNATATVLADSTRYVILPFETSAGAPTAGNEAELMAEALSRWRGISVVEPFEVADALRRAGPLRSGDDARRLALSLHARRFIRTRLDRRAAAVHLRSAIYAAEQRDSVLHVVQATVAVAPNDSTAIDAAIGALADSLILRTASVDTAIRVAGTRSIPALQDFARALAELSAWNLVAAESLFRAAAAIDPGYTRAAFWELQTGEWQRKSPVAARAQLERVLADSTNLTDRERAMTRGLSALARSSFPEACDVYDAMRRRNDRDFAAWFGLGRCRALDDVVLPSAASPSGWAFRSSYRQAVQDFEQAFLVLPSVSQWFERGGFQSLQSLLYTSAFQRRGGRGADTDTLRFAAFPTLDHDTLAFVPYRAGALNEPQMAAWRTSREHALAAQRAMFRRLAESWMRSLPNNVGVREAFALALDLTTDRASIDSVRSARALSTDRDQQTRLAATEVILRVKYGLPGDQQQLARARQLGDSILRAARSPAPAVSDWLVPVAAFVGDCDALLRAARSGANDLVSPIVVPRAVDAAQRALIAVASTGCGGTGSTAVEDLARATAAVAPDSVSRARLNEALMTQSLPMLFPAESSLVVALARSSSSSTLRLERFALLGRADSARAVLESIRHARAAVPGGEARGTFDAVLAEARSMVALRDTTLAIGWLDAALEHLAEYPTRSFYENLATGGALMRTIALRAALARARNDRVTARRWALPVLALWATPSPALLPELTAAQQAAR